MLAESRTEMLTGPLWLDAPDAAQRISVAPVSDLIKQAALDLVTRGIAVLPGLQSPELCRQAIEDYREFCLAKTDYVNENRDELGREKRLVNFHLYSEAALKLGLNETIMGILDFAFGAEAGLYTSLTFKYGTQQPVHRDTPHFATWPDGYFVGVWTALEDIVPEAGPLFYYEGGHRFDVDAAEIWRNVKATRSDLNQAESLDHALDLYNGRVIDEAPSHGRHVTLDMKCGDVVIWHPQLPHGGMVATDPMRSRWSLVCHCAPVDKQVHQHREFFLHADGQEPPARYEHKAFGQRKVALAGDVAFQA